MILTKGTAGDLIPFIGAGHALHVRGHDVTIVSHCVYKSLARHAGLKFVELDDSHERESFLNDIHLLNTPKGVAVFFERHCLPRVLREYGILARLTTSGPAVLLTRHMASLADLLAAERLQLPLVRVFTARSQVATLGLLEELLRTLFSNQIGALRRHLGLPGSCDWGAFLRLATANIGNWPDWFAEGETGLSIPVRPVGFLKYDPAESGEIPSNIETFLQRRKPAVLVSPGTGDFLSKEFYSASILGCIRAGLLCVLVSAFRRLLPEELCDSVRWVPYLPFASAMPRFAAVIHHGGSGTIARAIDAGIPQLILPYGADRPDNALRLKRLGIADCLPASMWKAETVAVALDRLLSSAELRHRCSLFADKVHQEVPCQHLCDHIERIASSHA